MKIHEYQGKEILRQFGVPVPRGVPAFTVQEAVEAAQKLGGPVWVVKAQIHAGGRGKGGGVKVTKSVDGVKDLAGQILGMQLVTHQTGPEGQKVRRLYIEEGADIQKEYYVSLVTDRQSQKVAFIASSEGGMDIEEVAHSTPEKIITEVIDPLTGLLGPVGVSQMKGYQFFAEKFSGAGNPAGVKFDITFIDNKLSPAESLNALKAAIDQGARYIVQGNGSSVALALVDAINKHNERNPGKEVLYLNDSAVDPDLTNSKCSYWHFRFDADTSMKMEAMSSFMAEQKDIKNVYILGQNYSHGVQVAKYTNQRAAEKLKATGVPGPELSLGKLMLTNNLTATADFVAKVLGPRLVADSGEWGTYAWSTFVCGTPGMRIAGGSDETLRNIISERVLGLPRVK